MENRNRPAECCNGAYEALRREFETFLHYLPDALIQVDTGLRATYANRMAGILLGYEPEAITGMSVSEIVDAEGLALALRVHAENMARLAETGPPYQRTGRQELFEVRFRRADGSYFPAEVQGSYVLDNDGMPYATRYIFRDITQRKAADAERRRSEAQLRQLASNAPVILFRMDREERFTLYEGKGLVPGMPALLDPGYVLGKQLSEMELIPPRLERLLKAGLDGQPGQERFELGHLVFDIAVEPLLAEDGTPDGLVGVATNSTEIVQTERALYEAQKLESLGMLASGMAHEFSEVLSTILGLTTVLAQSEPMPGGRPSHLAAIEAAARHGAELTHRLVTFARSGREVVTAIDLREVLNEAARLVRRGLPNGTVVEVRLPEREVPVLGDSRQLTQAVLNMLVNARDAMPLGGAIRLSLEARAEHATIMIEDSGCGMDEETQLRLFEPFFTTKAGGPGVGLGMPIAYAVMRAHNGTISVRSARGQGTTLAIRLPFNPETQLEAGSEQGATLLVVDDDSASRRATAAILEHFGFQTVQASDGPQAIERFQQRPEQFTAVIMHLKEAGLSQEETSRAIAAIRPDVTILAASNGALVDFTRPETKALLGKSFTPDQLARVLMASGVGKQA